MDANAWITVAGFIASSAFTVATILYNRGRADEKATALATVNREESIGRFKLNESRITEAGVRIDGLATDVRALQNGLKENSVLLARIDERTLHMVSVAQRIEDKIDANKIIPKGA